MMNVLVHIALPIVVSLSESHTVWLHSADICACLLVSLCGIPVRVRHIWATILEQLSMHAHFLVLWTYIYSIPCQWCNNSLQVKLYLSRVYLTISWFSNVWKTAAKAEQGKALHLGASSNANIYTNECSIGSNIRTWIQVGIELE